MQKQIKDILLEIGEDPDREGLVKTPERVEKAWKYLMRGYNQNLEEVVNGAVFQCRRPGSACGGQRRK